MFAIIQKTRRDSNTRLDMVAGAEWTLKQGSGM
ncbi:hypothetical protein FOPG_18629 [Fusarium oxysporum f. sp. conglutinans race 2 54008]|uniref:Uncharacterized protein n=1 Tax=Fusarium oxysporum f. sp. conglutinans race 2 54008 TaxID=1089457 RepID=X0GZ08_FUSOX|nr:hypothetical protein FOPG_18629 [Fusarium oxysporum f. sp. conglutinans race 2 54008]